MKPLISVDNISMSYGTKQVLKDISFDVYPQDFLMIIGENGSGKSTLIKGLLGLKTLDSGTITFDGIQRNEIGYLPQYTQIQRDFPASVMEVVTSGCVNRLKNRLFYNRKDKMRVLAQMERLKILDLKDQYYQDLSLGQKQRVLLARALCATDKVLILDEPVSSLDPQITHLFYELLKELNEEYGLTIIMITHDISQVVDEANKVLHLHQSLIYFGLAKEYLLKIPQGDRHV